MYHCRYSSCNEIKICGALEPWLLGHAMLICVSFSRDARKKGESHKKQKTKDREHHRRHSQHVKRYAFIILTKYVF